MNHVAKRSRLREHTDRRLTAELLKRGGEFEQRLLLFGGVESVVR